MYLFLTGPPSSGLSFPSSPLFTSLPSSFSRSSPNFVTFIHPKGNIAVFQHYVNEVLQIGETQSPKSLRESDIYSDKVRTDMSQEDHFRRSLLESPP